MLTDNDLSDLLRESLTDATSTLTPPNDLAATVRRRHISAQRRRTAARVAVPTVAAASIAGALAAPTKHIAAEHSAAPRTTSLPSSAAVPVSYRVAFPAQLNTLGCVPRPTSPSAIVTVYADGSCAGQAAAVIIPNTTLPANAEPITTGPLADLHDLTSGHSRTVWAPNSDGSYSSVTVNSSTPDADIASFFTPAH